MEINRNTVSTQVVKQTHQKFSEIVDWAYIKLKLSACVERDVEETKGAVRILLLMLPKLLLLCKLRMLIIKLNI